MVDEFEHRRKPQEDLILLVLGAVPDTPMSKLHLEKDVFLLYKFHPAIHNFIEFSAHLRGPYSSEIADAIQDPYFRTESWEYTSPKKGDKYSSGYIKLTEKGKEEYKTLYRKMLSLEKMRSLLAGIEIVRRMYDELTPKEFIFAIYETYPEMTTNSEIKNEIYADSEKITRSMQQKIGFVSEAETDYIKTESQHQ